MKSLVAMMLFCFFMVNIYSQDEGLSDKLAFKPNGREMAVKLSREDCNFLWYLNQKGGTEQKVEWTRVLTYTYENQGSFLPVADDMFSGEVPNYASAKTGYEKVLSDKNAIKWQKDKATFQIAMCNIGLGAMDKAKEVLTSITNESKWYFPAKLKMIDTLPDAGKVAAIRDLLKGSEVVGPFKFELSLTLIERLLSEGKGTEAKQAFDEAKKLNSSPDKYTLIQLDEYQIKIDVMNKNYAEAEKRINQYVSSGTETGLMRVALGDILLSKGVDDAFYEYLRGRLDFENVRAEAGYKAGKLFYELWQKDKINNGDYLKYAKRELTISRDAGDSVWSSKAQKMLDQLK